MQIDKIFCKGCNKKVDIYSETYVKKNDKWDLHCIHCDYWLGGMKNLIGWELENYDIQIKKSENKTMQR